MNRRILILLFFTFLFFIHVQAQRNECRHKPKRFPSAFTHLSSDYANMNLQADILPKRFFQLESSLSYGTLDNPANGEQSYWYNYNLLRIGTGTSFEFRAIFGVPGKNVQLNNEDINKLHPPLGAGLKLNLLSESSHTPGIGLVAEYTFFNAVSHFHAALILDKLTFRIFKLSLSAGPQLSASGSSKMAYSTGIVMKDRNKRLGVYSLATNRYPYLENIFHAGIVFSDNLNYQLTAGYGVNEGRELFMLCYTGLVNYKSLQRRFGAYF
jgi:hypothetical protein